MDETNTAAEKAMILEACAKHKTGKEIAKALGFSRPTLYRRLKKHGIVRGSLNV